MKSILVTGCAGFIGFSISQKLIMKGYSVIGVDNLNNYYDRSYKIERLKVLNKYKKFVFYKVDINDYIKLKKFILKISLIKFYILRLNLVCNIHLKIRRAILKII